MKKKILIFILIATGALPLKGQQDFNYDSLSTFRILKTGLETNFNIKLHKQTVGEIQGQLTSAKGAFNPQLSLSTYGFHGTDPTVTFQNSYALDGQLLVPTRLGMKFYTGFKLSTETEIISGVPDYYPSTNMPINSSGMWAGISMPLLRDLGRNNSNNVAYLSTLMLNHAENVALTDEICQFIKNSLTSFYNTYQSVQVFKILQQADKDARQYLSDIEAMIADEQLPEIERYRAKAYQLNIAQQLSFAENEITNSFFDLITSVGIKGIKAAGVLPVFLDSLPDPASFPWKQYAAYVLQNVDSMVSKTPYFKNLDLTASSALITMNGAKHNKLNELDLDVRYMYFGTTAYQPFSDFNQTFTSGSPGSSLNFTLSYKIPFKNEERKGDYLNKLSSYEFHKTQLEKVAFESRMQVIKLLSDLGHLIPLFIDQVELAAVEKKTFDGEVQKFRIGISTQIDMINTYMDYNSALLNVENGRFAIMSRVIALKYLIGDFPTTTDQLVNYNPWVFSIK